MAGSQSSGVPGAVWPGGGGLGQAGPPSGAAIAGV